MDRDIKRLPVERKGIKTADLSKDMKMDIFFDKHYSQNKIIQKKPRFSSANTYGKNNFEDWMREFFQDPKQFIYKYSRKAREGLNG